MRVVVFVAVLLGIALAGCKQRFAEVGLKDNLCRITLGRFCIATSTSGYLLTIRELSPLHSSTLVIGESPSQVAAGFVAIVVDDNIPQPQRLVPDSTGHCAVAGVQLDSCDLGSLPAVWYYYEWTTTARDGKEYSGRTGIRVVLLKREEASPDFVKNIAYPCQFLSDFNRMCGPHLPVCRKGDRWNGCRV